MVFHATTDLFSAANKFLLKNTTCGAGESVLLINVISDFILRNSRVLVTIFYKYIKSSQWHQAPLILFFYLYIHKIDFSFYKFLPKDNHLIRMHKIFGNLAELKSQPQINKLNLTNATAMPIKNGCITDDF